MIPILRATSLLLLVATVACSDTQHPLDRQLSQLTPPAIVRPSGLDSPAGTLVCPLTFYQSTLSGGSSAAERVNAFLAKKQFKGTEGQWSLVIVKPAPAGEAGIEHLVFKRDKYDVVTSSAQLVKEADVVPEAFELKECVEVKEARVLVSRARVSNRKLISFGTEK